MPGQKTKIQTRSLGESDGRVVIEVRLGGEEYSMTFERREDGTFGVPDQSFDPPLTVECLEAAVQHAQYLQGGWVDFKQICDCWEDEDEDEDENDEHAPLENSGASAPDIFDAAAEAVLKTALTCLHRDIRPMQERMPLVHGSAPLEQCRACGCWRDARPDLEARQTATFGWKRWRPESELGPMLRGEIP